MGVRSCGTLMQTCAMLSVCNCHRHTNTNYGYRLHAYTHAICNFITQINADNGPKGKLRQKVGMCNKLNAPLNWTAVHALPGN